VVHVKICGLKDLQSALTAAEAGAAFLGFNFVPANRRRIEAKEAKAIVAEVRRALGEKAPKMVGVFANQPALYLNATAGLCELDYIQLSGDEPLAAAEGLQRPVIKALRVDPEAPADKELRRIRQLLAVAHAKGILPLLDRYDVNAYGGTGKPFDWGQAQAVAQDHTLLLAGGLTPENVAQAVALVKPWGVDVASGVETDGVKDAAKIVRFIQEAQRAAAQAPTL
jgi:phosphoribosylanthranilate isomerase